MTLEPIRTQILKIWEDPINTAFSVGWKILSLALAAGVLIIFLALTRNYITFMITTVTTPTHQGN